MNSKVNRSSHKSMDGLCVIYLTEERLSINAHQKEILLTITSQSSGIPLGLVGHLGLGDRMPPTGSGPSLHPTTI